MRNRHRPLIPLLLLALVAACSKPAPQAGGAAKGGTDPIGQDPTRPGASITEGVAGTDGMAGVLDTPSASQNTDNPDAFYPLRSQQVKDAIYRALRSGQTQRWQDGKLTGYAVPSATTGPNGCRAVRYTVDQRPQVPFESINACSASR